MKHRGIARLVVLVALIGTVAWVLANRQTIDPSAIEAQVRGYGLWAPVVFVGVYALATVLFLPGSVLSLAGGALFGPLWGTLYNLTGATIGATLAFTIARYLASDWVARRSRGRLKQLIEGVEAEGWRFVAFVRLVPLFPFNLLNYALGLTRIKLSHYVITSWVCMIPGGFAYTYLGHASREAAAGSEGFIEKGLIALGLLAAVLFLPRLVRRLRRPSLQWMEAEDLKARLDGGEDLKVMDVREPEEFIGPLGHIPRACNVPLTELPQRIDAPGPSGGSAIVLVCKTDKRSTKAAQLLRDAGFRNVPVLRGGLERWRALGFDTSPGGERGMPTKHGETSQ